MTGANERPADEPRRQNRPVPLSRRAGSWLVWWVRLMGFWVAVDDSIGLAELGAGAGPVDITEAVEAVGAGGFACIGLSAVALGLPYLSNVLPLGQAPGAVDSSGTIVLISFFVGVEVAAAFTLIVGELLEQTLLVRQGSQ